MKRPFDFDTAFALFCISLAGAFGYGTYAMDEVAVFQEIGPRLWPAVLSVALAAVGAAILLGAGRGGDMADAEEVGASGAAWIVFLGILLAIPVIMLLGYLPAGVFLMAVILFLKETREHVVRSTVCALLVPAAIYYLFTSVFDQYLPTGILLP